MFRKFFKSHFSFNNNEHSGILILVLLIVLLIYYNYFFSFSYTSQFELDSPELLKIRNEIDSLRKIEIENRKPKLYPFNPNYISDYKAYTLGMSTEEFEKLKNYRAKGKWINSVSDFKDVTGVSQNWLDSISPYFKFPAWVNQPKKQKSKSSYSKELPYIQKIDLNTATKEQLMEISGVGDALSNRILSYRDKLGGFTDDIQLYYVYGLEPQVVQRALKRFTVKSPKEILKININEASASDLATLPGVSFDLAKDIWEFVRLRNGINNLEELTKIEEITPLKLQLIRLYLLAE